MGGVAVRFSSPSSTKEPLRRSYRDVDLVGRGSETRKIKELFDYLGYEPRETFNAMQGGRRLVFNDLANNRRIDIFQDYFEMCHKFDLRLRLSLREETLPLADLLMTKLQVVQINEKDIRDILALLIDHRLGETDDPDSVNAAWIVRVCSDDWGVFRTFTGTLEKILGGIDAYKLEPADEETAENRAQQLLEMIVGARKTLKWKLRARVGERAAWYETPEADIAVVDSRF